MHTTLLFAPPPGFSDLPKALGQACGAIKTANGGFERKNANHLEFFPHNGEKTKTRETTNTKGYPWFTS